MDRTTRLLIAEDQGMMRSALATLLDLEDDLTVVAQVARGDEVVAAVEQVRPDVCLLDIELPGRSGLDVIGDVVRAVPSCAVVIVTTFGRPGYLRRALQAGARAFLVKDDPVEDLAAAIRRVLAGEIVVDPQLAARTLGASPNPLSERERQVLTASADGATIADVAARLHLSPSTVRNYLSAAIGKTDTRNRAEAYRRARDQGWL
ncbi:two component transcriptional regulator, LuxR family [Micromonospora echinaurantiaca]|uniref:Two component transcriptional regulator, LuxR family n=1 Tax=Micromonospora echinaurantiaca TaxID=47857 RepID=A0A1C5HHQ8_9ACTN|nr:response regulator transcription factor [Micromonospora echinaurantiaca]SCG45514.1 two component transcriptional regulator, LuxR family [Micromonospora echinaurantiaca]